MYISLRYTWKIPREKEGLKKTIGFLLEDLQADEWSSE